MKDFFQKLLGQVKELWGKWTPIQKGVLVGVVVLAIAGIAVLVGVSGAPTTVPVIDTPIRDQAALDRITTRINEEGVSTTISASGVIMVRDEATARRMRAILIREDLIPQGTDPWAIFDIQRWTITDFERKVNVRRAVTQAATDLIKSLDDVDDAKVSIVMPETTLFTADQNPVTASVVITPRVGSDIIENRKKIEGIQKILKYAVEGLQDTNIVITNQNGLVLNDFEGMAGMDRIAQTERQQKLIQTLQTQYRAKILASLQSTFTSDRVRDLDVNITMDMSPKTVNTTEYFPITLKERTPGLAYDDSASANSLTRSKATSTTSWEGTGFNPEGPAGVEGQTPPVMQDMSNLYGKVNQTTEQVNEEINQRIIQEEKNPMIDKVTVSVNIDGEWQWKYDDKKNPVVLPNGSSERDYTALSSADISAAEALIQGAIGYDAGRGDSVVVQNIRFDRTSEFAKQDAEYFRRQQIQTTIIIALGGLALVLVGFLVIRWLSQEAARRKRLREEQLQAEQMRLRAEALQQAENDGIEVSMSVEEKRRMELEDNAKNMAREHPGDVAALIRTWILEE
jgi:flagellar M-ring protein FliF